MEEVFKKWCEKSGSENKEEFLNLRDSADNHKPPLIKWGRSNPARFGGVLVATSASFRGLAPEAFLQLTQEGCSLLRSAS
jgi:hypothetical protein